MKETKAKFKAGSISLPEDMWAWLRRAAAKENVPISYIIRRELVPKFETRHAK